MFDRAGGHLDRRAFGHDQLGDDVVRRYFGEKHERDVFADQHADHDHQDADKQSDGGVAEANRPIENWSITSLYEALQAVGDFALLAPEPAEVFAIVPADFAQCQVVGEYQFRFDQRPN